MAGDITDFAGFGQRGMTRAEAKGVETRLCPLYISVAPASVPAAVGMVMNSASVTLYRRNLPHLRMEGAVYFVTWRLREGQSPLTNAERDDVAAIVRHFDSVRYRLHAYVVMDDHVHVLVEPMDGTKLQDILRSWKSFSANQFQRKNCRCGILWQREYFDRIVRDDTEYEEKRDYILGNPFKRWPDLNRYAWIWAIGI